MTPDLVDHTLTVAGRELRLLRPRDPEALLDVGAFADDEFLPYWAELWPSAQALVDLIAARELAGTRVLELGCGLGLPSLAAALAGAEVTATDWSADAIALLERNAARNRVTLRARVWRWGDDTADLGPRWPLVIASDVLYERRNGPWLRSALDALLAAGGEAWIADPGRATAQEFLAGLPEVAPRVYLLKG